MEQNEKDIQNQNELQNKEAILKEVRKAAREGAWSGKAISLLFSIVPALIVIILLVVFVMPKINSMSQKLAGIHTFESGASDHDLVLEDNGIFGYTAADFADAILGDSSKLKKLEVFVQEVSDAATVTNAGLLNWSVFSKNQLITYNGTAVYTVDLSSLKKNDILLDEESKIITLRIPHAVREEINIPEDQIKFGDTNRGLLAFGEIKMSAEDAAKIQAEARSKMEEKLDDETILETADRFAILTVWELYSPIIKGVAKDYSLEVEFR